MKDFGTLVENEPRDFGTVVDGSQKDFGTVVDSDEQVDWVVLRLEQPSYQV